MSRKGEIAPCTCKGSRRDMGIRCLTCAPMTEMELHRIQRARETGKVKPPSWWKPCKLPDRFEPDLRQKYPSYVRAMFTKQSDPFLDRKLPDASNINEYVRQYVEVNHLKA